MVKIIDGKILAQKTLDRVKRETASLHKKFGRVPCLAIISVGEDAASKIYLRKKREACAFCGVRHLLVELPVGTTQKQLLETVRKMNAAPGVNGLIVQMPLPLGLNANEAVAAVSPEKDVDGFTPENVGRLFAGDSGAFVPATAKGVMVLVGESGVELEGANAVVVGKGLITGKPIALLLANANATVTMCDKFTKGLAGFTKKADVLVSATGVAGLIKKSFVKKGAIVIDVGITRLPDGKIVGDVAFDEVSKALGGKGVLTPVPGGVGPMTVAMLVENTLEAFKKQNSVQK